MGGEMTIADHIATRPRAYRRALAVLLIPAAAMLLWVLLLMPLQWLATGQEDWRRATRAELSSAKSQALAEPIFRRALLGLPSAPVWKRFYSEQDAEAGVQQDVSQLSAEAGLGNLTITALPAERDAQLAKYSVRLSGTATAEQLRALAVRLREHSRYLRVERLNVTVPQTQTIEENAILTATLDIAGFAGVAP
jgi:hypothetical protein